MVFSLVYVIGIVIQLDISFPRQLLYALIISMSVKFIINNTIIVYLSILTIFLGGLLVNTYISPIYPYFERLASLLVNIYDHLFSNVIIRDENILPFWVLITGIYSLLTSLFLFRPKEKLFSLLVIYLPLFIYYWYIFVNQAYFALAFFLLSYILVFGLLSFTREKSKIEPDTRSQFSNLSSYWNRTSFVYALLIVIIALILPKSENTLRWYWMEDQIASILPKIEEMRSTNNNARGSSLASSFNITGTGFQEDPSQLGGPVSPNHQVIMNVSADRPTYLRGSVRHFYNGSIWETTNTNVTSHLLQSNFSNISSDDRTEFYEERDIIVQFVDYSSTTLFSPYMPIVANAHRGSQIFLTDDSIIELLEGIYDGESYGIKVLDHKSYGDLVQLAIDNSSDDIESLNNYLQVPTDVLSQRTIDLKDEILRGIDGDLEKAIAIESYLRNNFEYRLDTAHIPEGQEFIDYFLFEEQGGYCTYYATTMAIFLRLEGIPTRYVEGYIAQETEDGQTYSVRQSHAHAWVEAFIEPIGWMTFEPTPAYEAEDRIIDIEPEDEIDDEINQDDQSTSDLDNDFIHEIMPDDDLGVIDDGGIAPIKARQPIFTRQRVLTILTILVLILPARFLINLIKYRIKEYKIKKLSNSDKMLVLYEKILALTEKLGATKEAGETHYEYSNRIGYKFKGLKDITKIFVKNKYGKIEPSDQEMENFLHYRKELEDNLRDNLGRLKYYLQKY